MQVPPEIMIKGVEATPYMDKIIKKGLDKLEHTFDRIISTRVTIEKAQGRHRTGNPYRMNIDIEIPDHSNIVVERLSRASKKIANDLDEDDSSPVRKTKIREDPLTAFISRTFDSAQRELQKTVDKQRHQVKTHPEQQAQAIVEKIFPEQEYGFLRTLDGQQVYFHKNSVLHKHWERLTVGTAVRCNAEVGDKGLQATTVEPVEKPGAAEIHGQLHDSLIVS